MAWDTDTEKYEIQEKWQEKLFRPRGTRAPEFLDKEPVDHYRKRLMTKAAPFVAADLQEVKTDHLYGSALDHYEQRYFESAAAEVKRVLIRAKTRDNLISFGVRCYAVTMVPTRAIREVAQAPTVPSRMVEQAIG
jgi:hypothetical protein